MRHTLWTYLSCKCDCKQYFMRHTLYKPTCLVSVTVFLPVAWFMTAGLVGEATSEMDKAGTTTLTNHNTSPETQTFYNKLMIKKK